MPLFLSTHLYRMFLLRRVDFIKWPPLIPVFLPVSPPLVRELLRRFEMDAFKLGALLALLVIVAAARNQKESPPPPDVDDWYRVIQAFPRVVAISTSSNHTSFKCLSGRRTSFNAANKTASYIWRLKRQGSAPRKTIHFDVEFGNSTHRSTYYVNNNRTQALHADVIYTDYENCVVSRIPTHDHEHCALWVKWAVARRVPRVCLDRYEAACDVRVPVFDRSICTEEDWTLLGKLLPNLTAINRCLFTMLYQSTRT